MGVQDNVVNTAQPYINYIYKRHKNTQCQQLYGVYLLAILDKCSIVLALKTLTVLHLSTFFGRLFHCLGALHWKQFDSSLLLGLSVSSFRPHDLVGALDTCRPNVAGNTGVRPRSDL